MKSCIYAGTVRHRRFVPVRNEFRYRVFQMYLDLDELPGLFDPFRCWSARGPAVAWFRRSDHFGDTGRPIADCVRDEVERQSGRRPSGPIRLLTNLRYFGYVINPVSYYYCFDASGDVLESVLAEVRNTPWGECHLYTIDHPVRQDTGTPLTRWSRKAFHVSPFMPMNMAYRWRMTSPGQRLAVSIQNHEFPTETPDGQPVNAAPGGTSGGPRHPFDVSLVLERMPITGPGLRRILLTHPAMTMKVAAAIYWQAARLWLRKAPFFAHPSRPGKKSLAVDPGVSMTHEMARPPAPFLVRRPENNDVRTVEQR